MRPSARLMLSLALGVSMTLPVSLSRARASGRDYPRCIQACNYISAICDSRCDSDCAALYPNDPALRQACRAACGDVCRSIMKDCKDYCLAIKKGEVSSEEP